MSDALTINILKSYIELYRNKTKCVPFISFIQLNVLCCNVQMYIEILRIS